MADGTIRPFSLFVVKLHSRCNIACTYCYVYEHADQSWRDRPMTMDDATIDALARRIGEHAATHRLPVVRVVLHGGEPLMAGSRRIRRIADELRRALPAGSTLDLRMQTNGVLLADEELCDVVRSANITVSVSLDGSRAANDRHRLYRDGRSSYDAAVGGIRRLSTPRNRAFFAGLLCTVDTANDPIETYEALAELDPPRVDFLLPHGNWDNPPPQHDPGSSGSTPYADWLLAIHDRWISDGRRLPIRVFDSIRSVLSGGGSLTEALGTDAAGVVVVETDGTIEQADSLKTAYHGAPVTGLSVFKDSFDDAAHHPGFLRGGEGAGELSAACRRCPVVEVCGGGLYAHRYRSSNGFDNPSVHCADLFKLITHVSAAVAAVNPSGEVPDAAGDQPAETTHQMPDQYFDALASGLGGSAELGFLMGTQDSINRLYIAEILDAARSRGAYSHRLLDLVEDVDRATPEGFRQVLAHPYVRVWALRCLDRLNAKVSEPDDLEYLAAIAVAAAARGGVALEAVQTVRKGIVYLPTLGLFTFDRNPPAELLLRTVAGRQTNPGDRIVADPAAGTRWHPIRTLRNNWSTVVLEDSDPDRDCHGWPVADRLTGSEAAGWQEMYRAAWNIIQTDHPAYAPGLSAGLSTIVPLADRPGTRVSSTARLAAGAVAIARPNTADNLAMLLIHEFQHVKLGALMDLFDLHDPEDLTLYKAPWRNDLRPLEGYLQGVYAHAAVADVWRSRWLVHQSLGIEDTGHTEAGAEYAYWRRQVVLAVETLSSASGLTDLGRRFFGLLGERVTRWLDDPLPAAAHHRARALAEQRLRSG